MKKINTSTKFFLSMVLLYIITYFISASYTKSAFLNFIKILENITPMILIVFTFMFLINLFLKPKSINKHLGKDSGLKGWIYSIIAGVLIPSPPYVIYPLLGEFKEHGMKQSLIASFLYNRNLQISFLPVMAYYFGLAFTIVVSTYVFIFAIISGILIEKIVER